MIKLVARVAAAIGAILTILAASVVPATADDGWTSGPNTTTTTTQSYGSTSSMSVPICVQPGNTAANVPVYAAWKSWRISGLWYTYRPECRGPQAVEIHVRQVFAGTSKALGWSNITWGSDGVPHFAVVYLNKSHKNRPGTYYSWQGTIAHEIGHVLHATAYPNYHNDVYGSILNLDTRPAEYPSTWDRKYARWYWQKYR